MSAVRTRALGRGQSEGKGPQEATGTVKAAPGRVWVWLALLAVYFIWGSTYLGIRLALAGGRFPPFLMAGTRFLAAGSLLYLFLRLRGAPNPSIKQWGVSAVIGALMLLGSNGLVTFAEQWVASGLAALAIGTVPIWAALFAALWGKRPGLLQMLGLGLGFAGVVLLNMEGDMRGSPLGALALILSPICWAFGSVWGPRLPLPGGMMTSAAEMLTGGALLTLTGLASGERMSAVPPLGALAAWGYLVVFGSIIAFSAYLYLLDRVRPSTATSYAYVNPAVAVILGVWLAGERLTWLGVAAMLVILGGVGLVLLSKDRRPAA